MPAHSTTHGPLRPGRGLLERFGVVADLARGPRLVELDLDFHQQIAAAARVGEVKEWLRTRIGP